MSENDKKTPKVVYDPHVQAQMEKDPELAKAMREFSALAQQAMQSVIDGRYANFDEAMNALGLEPKPLEEDDPHYDEAMEAFEAFQAGKGGTKN